jgi:hypothetical protein
MEKGIKPPGVLLFLLCVFVLLLLVSVVFPPGGIRVGPDMYLYFPGVRDILTRQIPDMPMFLTWQGTWIRLGNRLRRNTRCLQIQDPGQQ